MLKTSKFTKYFPIDENKWGIYNSYSASIIEISEKYYQALKANNFSEIEKEDLDELVNLNILTESDDALVNKLKFELFKSRYDTDNMHLTITPTYFCNFNCPYCYEESRPKVFMSDETEQNLIQFVTNRKPETLDVTWYGGEALLAFDRICSITHRFQKLVKHYHASIVTNGYLMDRDKILKFKELGIDEIQITFDGTKEIHDKTRILRNGNGTFDKIVQNLETLFSITNEIRVAIRSNIDLNNKDHFYQLNNFISEHFKNKNIFVYPAMVMDLESPNGSSSCNSTNCLLSKETFNEFMFKEYTENNNEFIDFMPQEASLECMAKHINAFLIGADGEVYKCWLDVGKKEKSIMNINSPEKQNYNLMAAYMVDADVFEDKKCTNCVLLPSCEGGCPYERLEKKYKDSSLDICPPSKKNLNEYLKFAYIKELELNNV